MKKPCQTVLLFFLFLNLHYIASFSFTVNTTSALMCSYDQSHALIEFKNNFTIYSNLSIYGNTSKCSHPKTNSWHEGQDCCDWDGVTCDTTIGQVIGLDLSCSWLQGRFSSNSSLFLLQHLQTLNLAFNDFTGSEIPQKLSQFQRLTHLNLSYSNFFGQVPIEISYLSNLVSLDLSSFYSKDLWLTKLTMTSLVQNLTDLKKLNLANVNLSLVGSDSLRNISSSLTSLALSMTGLTGIFPTNIFRLPNLQLLHLSGNFQLQWDLQVSLPTTNWSATSLRELEFSNIVIKNGLPSSIGNLKSFKYMSISKCRITGSIPNSIGNLTSLEYLDLSDNELVGSIPLYMYSLPLLRYLDLSYNQVSGHLHPFHSRVVEIINLSGCGLQGPIPTILFPYGANQVTSLDLSGNSLNGTIPSSLFTLLSLLYLDLGDNQLVGRIPSSITCLANLKLLDFSSNNLSGTIDTSMYSKLQSLINLNGSSNSLSFTTNINLNHSLPNLEYFYFSSNNVTEFPIFLRGSKILSHLDLSNNKIDGGLPEWLWDVGRDTLNYLNLAHNSLTKIDKLAWTNLQYIDLRSNLLRGRLPLPPSTLSAYFISNNSLTGDIPTLICNTSFMEVFDLSRNYFTGTIPKCLGNIDALTVLDLSTNRFHGRIPNFSGHNERSLKTLNLNGNQLEGKLPTSLVNCEKLEVLDIGNNNISDTFPQWLRFITKLQVLVLKSNNFHGYIHDYKFQHSFQKLRIFDVSNNNFVGFLPTKYIQSLEAMKQEINGSKYMESYYGGGLYYEDSISVTIKGSVVKLEKILTTFMTIDFSSNKFGGEMLRVFGTLIFLKSLNLSHNNLFGHIPSSIGNLRNLESLDLSSNKLDGTIPTELASLTFLEVLNLSQNALIGSIPSNNNFDTQFDNNSYQGNLALCGPPLSKKCGTEKSPLVLHEEDIDSDDDDFDFDRKFVLYGYISGLVIGLSIGYIVFSGELSIWLAKMVQRYRLRKLRGQTQQPLGRN